MLSDRYLPLLHRLQQRALYFGGGAIDFIGQNQIGKNRAELGGKFSRPRIVDEGADQIRWQKVWGELQALKSSLDAGRHRFDCERLGQSWDALEQKVTIREQPE